jgi:energy-coupling factor transporter ATP-binding protein EcfA2
MRVKLRFAGQEVEFVDRERAIKQVEEIAERGVFRVHVVYGPEGCGKTSLLRQAVEVLKEHDYEVVYINPLAESFKDRLSLTSGLKALLKEMPGEIGETIRLIDASIELLYTAVKRRMTRKIALLSDDVFQAIGVDRAEVLVKSLLNMIEHPPVSYEKAVVIVTSSEGITRERIGRHRWAALRTLWNMSKDGFEELYNLLPDPKPDLDSVWRLAGGNPKVLETLFENKWNVDTVINELIQSRNLTHRFVGRWRKHLESAVEDPDYLWSAPEEEVDVLVKELVDRNLIVYFLPERSAQAWVDLPPSEKDPELGIGRYVAWQTPLHREAVRRALELLEH